MTGSVDRGVALGQVQGEGLALLNVPEDCDANSGLSCMTSQCYLRYCACTSSVTLTQVVEFGKPKFAYFSLRSSKFQNSSTMPQWRLSTSLTGSLLASFIWGLRFSTVTMLPLPFALKGSGSWMTIERVSGYLSLRCSSSPTFTCCGQLRSRRPQEAHDLEQPMRM